MAKADDWGQGQSIPVLGDQMNVEAFVPPMNGMLERTVMRFTNATARAAAIPTPTHGMVTSLVAEDRVDRWDGSRWFPITPGPWHAFPFNSGYGAEDGSPGYRFHNGNVEFRGQVRRTSGGQFYTGGPWTIGMMPSAWRPASYASWPLSLELGASVYFCRGEVQSSGEFILYTPSGSTSSSNGLHWASLDAARFSLDTPPATL